MFVTTIRDFTERVILEASLRVFARFGFSAAGVVDIAREARISTSTLYAYFESKDAMLRAVVHWVATDLYQRLTAARHQPGPVKRRFVAIWRELVRFSYEWPDGARFLLALRGTDLDPRDRPLMVLPEIITQLFEPLAASGELQTANAKLLASLTWSTFLGVLHAQELDAEGLGPNALNDAEVMLWRAFARAAASRRETGSHELSDSLTPGS